MRILLPGLAILALSACEPEVPDSGAGVGFGDYDSYTTERERELAGTPPQNILPPPDTADSDTQIAAAETTEPVAVPREISADNPAISDEQDFDAVSARESIESDAERRKAQQQNYVVIEPTAVPKRSGKGPNIVEYALQTTNSVGERLYRRSSLRSAASYSRACSKYASPDLAQEAFLARGGPEKDRLNLDPDGDGFACGWNPAPFRLAKR